MAGKTRLPKLALSTEQLSELQQLSRSQTAAVRVQRAGILCRYHAGETVTGISRAMKITRKSVRKWIDKALAMGAEAALKDAYHRPHAPGITEQVRAWVVHLACSKPKELGYATELWTRSLLAHVAARDAAGGTSFSAGSRLANLWHRAGDGSRQLRYSWSPIHSAGHCIVHFCAIQYGRRTAVSVAGFALNGGRLGRTRESYR